MFSLIVPSRLSQKVTSLWWVLFLYCYIAIGLVVQLITHNDDSWIRCPCPWGAHTSFRVAGKASTWRRKRVYHELVHKKGSHKWTQIICVLLFVPASFCSQNLKSQIFTNLNKGTAAPTFSFLDGCIIIIFWLRLSTDRYHTHNARETYNILRKILDFIFFKW